MTEAVLVTTGIASGATTPPSSAINALSSTLTVEFWMVSPPQATACTIIGTMNTSRNMGWRAIQQPTGVVTFNYWDGAGERYATATPVAYIDRTWHHYAFVKNGTTYTHYVDGAQVMTGTYPGTGAIVSSTLGLGVGRIVDNTNQSSGGAFAEVRIWSTARTGAQISANKDVRAAGTETGLVACWSLDSTTGVQELDLVAGLALQFGGAFFLPSTYPPPRPTLYEPGSGGGATSEDIENLLAGWLSSTDVTHADSLPKLNYDTLFQIRQKLGFLEGALDIQIADFRAWVEFGIGQLDIGIAKIDNQTKPSPGVTPVPNDVVRGDILAAIAAHDTAMAAQHQAHSDSLEQHHAQMQEYLSRAVQVVSGHPSFDIVDPELPVWSITGDVNAHTDAALVLLQGDLQVHEDQTVGRINPHTTAEADRAIDTINAWVSTETNRSIETVNENTDQESTRLEGAVNNHTDALGAILSAEMLVHRNAIMTHVDDEHVATRAHVTTQADRVIDAMPSSGGGSAWPPSDVIVPVNAHTTAEANRTIAEVNAETNRVGQQIVNNNNAQTAIIVAVQGAVATIDTVVHDILGKVDDVLSRLTGMASDISQILALLQGGSSPPLTPTKVGETTFNGTVYWPQPADYYEIEVDVPGQKVGQWPIPLGTHYRFLGWCAPRVAGKYTYGQPLAFSSQRVDASGILPDGLLAFVKQGTTGRISAFRYL